MKSNALIIGVVVVGVIVAISATQFVGSSDELSRVGVMEIDKNVYTHDDFSFEYPSNWYPYENEGAIFFTHEEDLGALISAEGFTIDSWFQVVRDELGEGEDQVATIGEWFARNEWDEESEFLISREKVVTNDVPMTRLVVMAAGVEGEVLHYVYHDDANITILTQYPYVSQSADTIDFEAVVQTFSPRLPELE